MIGWSFCVAVSALVNTATDSAIARTVPVGSCVLMREDLGQGMQMATAETGPRFRSRRPCSAAARFAAYALFPTTSATPPAARAGSTEGISTTASSTRTPKFTGLISSLPVRHILPRTAATATALGTRRREAAPEGRSSCFGLIEWTAKPRSINDVTSRPGDMIVA